MEPKFKMGQNITYDVPSFLSEICGGYGIITDMKCEKGNVDYYRGCSFEEGQIIKYEVSTNIGCPDLLIKEINVHEIE
jgi:hypothetical protein